LAIYKDQALIIDLEATCWEGYEAPPGQTNEIIEIGICVLNVPTREIGTCESLLVRPEASVISDFCTQLTGITQAQIDADGISFAEACHILETRYNSRNRLWASWGGYDHRMFIAQCKTRHIRYPFSDKHVNLKRLFADTYGKRMGLKAALEKQALTMEGRHHSGVADAFNAARVLVTMMKHNEALLRRYGL
jgi:inhibitor of KinA sporulation pathway (predicted exonuclease)